MGKDLTNSSIERQNVLNNPYAVQEIQKAVDIQCIPFEDRLWLTKEQIASFFEVTSQTIDNYISKYEKELRHNGYEVIHGNRLNKFRIVVRDQHVAVRRISTLWASISQWRQTSTRCWRNNITKGEMEAA